MTTDNDRPEVAGKASVAKRRNRNTDPEQNGNVAGLATRINYSTRDGSAIATSLDRIKGIDEVAPSGVFDVAQGKKEDVENQPIVVIDAMHMTGKYGPWFIAMCAFADEFSINPVECEKFTIPFNGTVLPGKIAAVMAQDVVDGRAIPGRQKSLPVAGKLVQIEGDEFAYWDFRNPNWTPGIEVVKPKLNRR